MSTLQVGDYQAEFKDGVRSHTVFERKSVSDLWGTLLRGHDRFKREMARAREAELDLVLIVEATISEVSDGFERSEFSGQSMLKLLGTMWQRHGLRTVFCSNRSDMANYILWSFKAEGWARVHAPSAKGVPVRTVVA